MATIRMAIGLIAAVAALVASPALAARRARPAPVAAVPAIPIAASDFALRVAAEASDLQASTRAMTRDQAAAGRMPGKGKQFTAVNAGPSWSYQPSRQGPLFEMGALGGGSVPDRPGLAHVGMAWQF